MAGYTRQSTFTDGDVIQAADSNDEFNQILASFNNSTGHAHDGTAAEGPIIGLIGDAGTATPLNKLSVDTVNDRFGFYVDVASVSTEQVRIEDGLVKPVTTNDVDLGTTVYMFKDGFFAGTLEAVNLEVTSIKANDGTASASIADSTGVFTITSAVLTTADINGGTIDNTVIGGTTPLAGDFTALGATGNITVGGTVDGRDVAADGTKLDGIEALADVTDVTNVTAAGALMDSELTDIASIKALNQGVATTDSPTFVTLNATTVNATTFDMTNLEVTNIKAKDSTASATIADTTGIMTIASSVLTTADINGGTIDGTIIGGTTPAAVTTSSLVATTADINAGTVDAVLGGTTPAAATVTSLTATGGGSLTGTWTDLGTVTTVDINGGTIDGAIIGGASAVAGSFTTLNASGVLTADLSTVSSTGDLAVADGGTGASTAAAARTNLDVDQAGTALALAIALG
tara:strand:- start:535 stop:1917 length:1383 start_codon:yes stop_codon:yes gene_type:complete